MKVYVDISQYWPEGKSVNAVYEELIMQNRKVDRRTLSAAKEGTLSRTEYVTLVRLRDWVRDLTNNENLSVDDLFIIEED